MKKRTRREFLAWAGAGAAWLAAGPKNTKIQAASSFPAALSNLGLASYTTRELSLDDTLTWAKRLGLTHVCLKDFHLPMNATAAQFEEVKKKFTGAGLDFYAVGVVYMRSEAETDAAFVYARNAGVRLIIGVPNHELLDLVERKIKETGIRLAIHNHGPTDKLYPTCASAFQKVENRDPGLGLCIDIGHSFRAGEDPAEAFRAFGSRILDVHMKDVDADGVAGTTVEMGRGRIDHAALLRAIARSDFRGVISFEYEKDGDNPIPGLAESVGYYRGLLSGIRS